jgi:hypothetical protein
MKVFMYMAALLCEACGLAKSAELDAAGLRPAGMDPDNEHTWDSDAYPKGPYEHGGGEADCPQHCDHCSLFLENPLTTEGVEYVRGAISEWLPEFAETHGGKGVAVWQEFYADELGQRP